MKTWNAHTLKPVTTYSGNEALSLMVETRLTKNDYLAIRRGAKERNIDLYPPYRKIMVAKQNCYPSSENITVTESSAKVKLQGLLDHTVSRIIFSQIEVFHNSSENIHNLTLITKWGCDGSTGHSEYKQVFTNENSSDSDIFLTSLVPLQLFRVSGIKNKEKCIFWQNPRPSSTRFCRPIHINFQKESAPLAKQETTSVKNEIENLHPTEVSYEGHTFFIRHEMKMTMIDGKICNVMTETASSQSCNICGATSKQMNDIECVKSRTVTVSSLEYGLSTLHAWIRFMEYFLHLAYKLQFQKWQARTDDEKNMLRARKICIQAQFKSELGLNVDRVKPGGRGTCNDGNTARRFFSDPSATSRILGLDYDCIYRSAILLQVMSSGLTIDENEFQSYSEETAKVFISTYPWYYIPCSVHKVLIHGASIIAAAVLPIGMMSEEAQESRNKDLKYYREHFSRKTSRIDTNRDLLNRFLVSSDPLISSLRNLPKRKRNLFFPEALALFKDPHMNSETNISSDSESE